MLKENDRKWLLVLVFDPAPLGYRFYIENY